MKNMQKKLGFESIQFQNKNFGKELELIIESIRNEGLSIDTVNQSKLKNNLKDCINNNTGMNTDIVFNNVPGGTAYEFAVLNINSAIYSGEDFINFKNTDLSQFGREIKKIKGNYEVDLKTGKVSGHYSKHKTIIYLEYDNFVMNTKFTFAEVTGVLLHEIGHGITQFEYGTRAVMTNQALASISNSLFHKNPPTKHLVYVRAAEELLELPPGSFDNILDVKDNKIIATIIVDKGLLARKSELGTPYYDSVAVEYLADQYVSRFGYGAHLAKALYKANAGFVTNSSITRTITRILEICTLITHSILIALFFFPGMIFGFLVLSLYMVVIINDGTAKTKSMTYDTLVNRYKRIREQTIEQLKDLKVPNEEIKLLIDDHKKITDLINKSTDFKPIYEKLLDLLFKSRKDANAAMNLQRQLEELASNDLFVKSAQLRTI